MIISHKLTMNWAQLYITFCGSLYVLTISS